MGVIVSFTMKLYKAPTLVVVFEAVFPISQFFLAFDTWQRWAPFVKDTRLSSNCSSFKDRVDIKGIFLGSQEELGNLLDPILSVPGGTFTITEKPFSQWFVSSPTSEQPFQKYTPGWYHEIIPQKGLQAIYDHLLVSPSPESNFFCLAWGGHTRKIPKGGTSFPQSHRNALFYAEPGAEFHDEKIIAQALNWVETLRLELSCYFQGGYVNVLDRSISKYWKEYYGNKNYLELQRIKKKYRSQECFSFRTIHYKLQW